MGTVSLDRADRGRSLAARREQESHALPGPQLRVTESEIEAVRSRYIRRVAGLIVLMLALIGGAWYGIYNYLGVKAMRSLGVCYLENQARV